MVHYKVIALSILALVFSNTSFAMGSLTKKTETEKNSTVSETNILTDDINNTELTVKTVNEKNSVLTSWTDNIKPIENCDVVATIRPIQLFVDQIRYGKSGQNALRNKKQKKTTAVVLEDDQDHHLFTLKPSQQRLIENAHVVFYISDMFDSYIPTLKQTSKDTLFFPLGTIKNLRLLATRKSGAMPHSYHGDINQLVKQQALDTSISSINLNEADKNIEDLNSSHLNHSHHNSGVDWHIWLNPDNAILMMGKIKQVLSALEPHNSEKFAANYQAAKMNIMQQTEAITAKLLKHMGTSFITLHDGYQYLEEQYGACVWKETQYSSRLINAVMGDAFYQVAHIDSLLQSNEMRPLSYTEFIEKITTEISNCLSL